MCSIPIKEVKLFALIDLDKRSTNTLLIKKRNVAFPSPPLNTTGCDLKTQRNMEHGKKNKESRKQGGMHQIKLCIKRVPSNFRSRK